MKRIVEQGGLYYIERKHWFWGWKRDTTIGASVDGMTWDEDISFGSFADAEKYLNPPKPEVIKVYP